MKLLLLACYLGSVYSMTHPRIRNAHCMAALDTLEGHGFLTSKVDIAQAACALL